MYNHDAKSLTPFFVLIAIALSAAGGITYFKQSGSTDQSSFLRQSNPSGEIIDSGNLTGKHHKFVVGYVRDIDTGQAIPNAKITFSSGYTVNSWQDIMVLSDSNGRYEYDFGNDGVPPIAVSFKPGYSHPNDLSDQRGIVAIPQNLTNARFESILMRRHNIYCNTMQVDFGPCRSSTDIDDENRVKSCEIGSVTSGHPDGTKGGCFVWKCQNRCD